MQIKRIASHAQNPFLKIAAHAQTGSRTLGAMRCLILLVMFAMLPPGAQAQQEAAAPWHFALEPYLMFPYMSGRTGVGNLPAVDVDADPGDIFSKLKIGAMLYAEAANDRWAITSDLIYMDLSQDVTGNALVESGEVNVQQLAWELAGLKRLGTWLEVGFGGRLNNMQAGVDLVKTVGDPKEDGHSLSETWIDPVMIVRAKTVVHEKWLLQFRGDFGGFGIGSDFTWQIQAYGGYQFSKLFRLSAGYRIISMDYDKGSGKDRFRYDINTFGPVIRFGFDF